VIVIVGAVCWTAAGPAGAEDTGTAPPPTPMLLTATVTIPATAKRSPCTVRLALPIADLPTSSVPSTAS
jgi:hypothetical protein